MMTKLNVSLFECLLAYSLVQLGIDNSNTIVELFSNAKVFKYNI